MILTRPQLKLDSDAGVAYNACGNNVSKLSMLCVSLCDSPENVWNAFSNPDSGLLNRDAGVLGVVMASVRRF